MLHIVREALANSLRHAAASRVLIRAACEDDILTVSVEDDGRGFDPEARSSGMGLHDMRERAGWCRSELEIRSAPARGTTVRIAVPVEARAMSGAAG